MHDLGNIRSYNNLKRWISEISNVQRLCGTVIDGDSSTLASNSSSNEFPSLGSLPKLIIGNKKDTISSHVKRPNPQLDLRIDAIESVSLQDSIKVLTGCLDGKLISGFLRLNGFEKTECDFVFH